METRWEKMLTPAELGILTTFLSFLFVASVEGRSDGRETPFPAGVLDDPAPDLMGFQGVLEVTPSNGQVAATVLRSSPGNLASLPVAPIQ